MKFSKILALFMVLAVALAACGSLQKDPKPSAAPSGDPIVASDAVEIKLSDDAVQVDGAPAGNDPTSAVYTANDIVYYESGKDFTYGEGAEEDAHSAAEAEEHTVVHITEPGTYSISGTLSRGQVAVDLGENAKEDPEAVVTLILNGVDITCDVAPAVIFYRVYECGNSDADKATKDVDTSAAGANVVIADGTTNTVNGSYVARIYKPGSVVLNEAGTEVEDAKKLHKYDGAFYSKMSMNVNGGKENTGVLNINAENEGMDSELHLTINGGNINIRSGNDGINTNEDGVSVTTVNGGALTIQVTGETGEGDGIDSNGWLVINGGTVVAAACSTSGDAGIDSDMGIHINGGTVMATGHMLDQIESGGQTYAVFTFAQKQDGARVVSLKNEDGKALLELKPLNGYSILVYSSTELKAGTYTLWSDDTQLAGQSGGGMAGGPGMNVMPGMRPDGMTPPEGMEGMTPPDGNPQFDGMQPPDGQFSPNGQERPDGTARPEKPEGQTDGDRNPNNGFNPGGNGQQGELTPDFKIADGANMFNGISIMLDKN